MAGCLVYGVPEVKCVRSAVVMMVNSRLDI